MTKEPNKKSKLQVNLDLEEHERFRLAAEMDRHRDLSSWVLRTLRKEADKVLAHYELDVREIMLMIHKERFPDGPKIDFQNKESSLRKLAVEIVRHRVRTITNQNDEPNFTG